jgi:hypothetical protein
MLESGGERTGVTGGLTELCAGRGVVEAKRIASAERLRRENRSRVVRVMTFLRCPSAGAARGRIRITTEQ